MTKIFLAIWHFLSWISAILNWLLRLQSIDGFSFMNWRFMGFGTLFYILVENKLSLLDQNFIVGNHGFSLLLVFHLIVFIFLYKWFYLSRQLMSHITYFMLFLQSRLGEISFWLMGLWHFMIILSIDKVLNLLYFIAK